MSQSPTLNLILFLVFQLWLTGVSIARKPSPGHGANRYLATFLMLIGFSFADQFLLLTGWYLRHPLLANWSATFPLAYGPLLWLYTVTLLKPGGGLTQKRVLHLLPFTIFFLASMIAYWFLPPSHKHMLLIQLMSRHIQPFFYVFATLLVMHFLLYTGKAYRLLSSYKAQARNQLSDPEQVNLNWLTSTLIFFAAMFLVAFIRNILQLYGHEFLPDAILLIIILSLFIFVNRIFLKTTRQPALFSWAPVVADLKSFSAFEKTVAAEKLSTYMVSEKPYLLPELTVELLANKLRMRPKELSTLINQHYGQNFFDFVNRYRIDEAKVLLLREGDAKITVLEVLYQVGFNSKSSFNTLFKKFTGMTPTEFRQNVSGEN
jgi:AraC-like DNA-binding protein